MNLLDDHDYEPPLVTQLTRLYLVLRAQRYTLASVMAAAGGLFLMQWQIVPETHGQQGYPVLGLPVLIAALALLVLPLERVASAMLWHVRFTPGYLGLRDHHWLHAMAHRHPALESTFRPYLEARNPVPLDALRGIWRRLVRAEENRPSGS
ncbi:MAG: hypothetical protein AB1766_07765 [Pseudomonadota bacterium]